LVAGSPNRTNKRSTCYLKFMKALVLVDKNQPLLVRDEPDPAPSPGDAIVRIHAAALNHRDLWIQKGQYAGLKFPIILGSDGAGIVKATDSADHGGWVGKEVLINPSLYWGDEQSHQNSGSFSILGLPENGTFAQYVKVPQSNLFEKPAHLSFEEAAALPLAGLTAYRGLFSRAKLLAGDKVLINGIGGGVALFALQFAVASKARVFITSGSEEKIALAIKLGAEGGVNYKNENWTEEMLRRFGSFDVIIDGAAGPGTGDLLNIASPGGRVVFYGATAGKATDLEMRRIFWKQLNILGTTMGSPTDFQAMINFVNTYSIKPVIDKIFPFHEANQALQRMNESKQFGKILLKMDPS
jgi:zinc-binding alcohol dehydrogenase/oxidoreductase